MRGRLGGVLVLSVALTTSGCRRSGAQADADADAIAADGFIEPAGLEPFTNADWPVRSVRPVAPPGFVLAGEMAGKAWLLRVDSSGGARSKTFERGALNDALPIADGRLAVAGSRPDGKVFVARIASDDAMTDLASFEVPEGSSLSAVASDGERGISAKTATLGAANGFVVAAGGDTKWSEVVRGQNLWLRDVTTVPGAVLLVGEDSRDVYQPVLAARLFDGGSPPEAGTRTDAGPSVQRPKSGAYASIVPTADGFAVIGKLELDGDKWGRLTVEWRTRTGELLARVPVGDSAPDVIGHPIVTSDGAVAFVGAWGPVERSEAALFVVARDRRWSKRAFAGPGKATASRAAAWLLDVRGKDATVVRVRTEPRLGYRIEHVDVPDPVKRD